MDEIAEILERDARLIRAYRDKVIPVRRSISCESFFRRQLFEHDHEVYAEAHVPAREVEFARGGCLAPFVNVLMTVLARKLYVLVDTLVDSCSKCIKIHSM